MEEVIIDLVNIEILDQGCVKVNDGYVVKKCENIVAISVDLDTKYAEILMSSNHNNIELYLCATDTTLNLLEDKDKDSSTAISFPHYKGWKLFAADIHRYTLAVCLIKE